MDLARLRRLPELYQRTKQVLDAYETEYTTAINHIVLKDLVAACKAQYEEASTLFPHYTKRLVIPSRTLRN
jgi:hypothetical protein